MRKLLSSQKCSVTFGSIGVLSDRCVANGERLKINIAEDFKLTSVLESFPRPTRHLFLVCVAFIDNFNIEAMINSIAA